MATTEALQKARETRQRKSAQRSAGSIDLCEGWAIQQLDDRNWGLYRRGTIQGYYPDLRQGFLGAAKKLRDSAHREALSAAVTLEGLAKWLFETERQLVERLSTLQLLELIEQIDELKDEIARLKGASHAVAP